MIMKVNLYVEFTENVPSNSVDLVKDQVQKTLMQDIKEAWIGPFRGKARTSDGSTISYRLITFRQAMNRVTGVKKEPEK